MSANQRLAPLLIPRQTLKTSLTWHPRFKFPTLRKERSNSPLPLCKWWSNMRGLPRGGCWSFEVIGAFDRSWHSLRSCPLPNIPFLIYFLLSPRPPSKKKNAWSQVNLDKVHARTVKSLFTDTRSIPAPYYRLRTVCFVPGERKPLVHFLKIQPA